MNWSKYSNFTESEFKCKCCGKVKVEPTFIAKLQKARRLAKTSFVITSAYRCAKHNSAVGGSKRSSHLTGWAVDIGYSNELQKYKILFGIIKAGFTRFGVSKNFIHVDCDPSKNNAIWTY